MRDELSEEKHSQQADTHTHTHTHTEEQTESELVNGETSYTLNRETNKEQVCLVSLLLESHGRKRLGLIKVYNRIKE